MVGQRKTFGLHSLWAKFQPRVAAWTKDGWMGGGVYCFIPYFLQVNLGLSARILFVQDMSELWYWRFFNFWYYNKYNAATTILLRCSSVKQTNIITKPPHTILSEIGIGGRVTIIRSYHRLFNSRTHSLPIQHSRVLPVIVFAKHEGWYRRRAYSRRGCNSWKVPSRVPPCPVDCYEVWTCCCVVSRRVIDAPLSGNRVPRGNVKVCYMEHYSVERWVRVFGRCVCMWVCVCEHDKCVGTMKRDAWVLNGAWRVGGGCVAIHVLCGERDVWCEEVQFVYVVWIILIKYSM